MTTLLTLAQIRTLNAQIKQINKLDKAIKETARRKFNHISADTVIVYSELISTLVSLKALTLRQGQTPEQAYNYIFSKNQEKIEQLLVKFNNYQSARITLAEARQIYKKCKEYNDLLDLVKAYNPNFIANKYSFKYCLRSVLTNNIYGYTPRNTESFIRNANECIKNINRHLSQLKEQERQKNLEKQKPLPTYNMTLPQAREIHYLCQKNNIDFRDFIEAMEDNRNEVVNYVNARNILNSIWHNQLSFDEYKSGSYFQYENEFYSEDHYCITLEEEITDHNSCSWCEYSEEYTSDPVDVYTESGRETWARTAAEENAHQHNGDYYTEEGLYEHGLRLNDYGDVVEGSQYIDECDYLNKPTYFKTFSDSEFKIGFEIEKEDRYVLESIEIDSFKCETNYLWRKEEDGSLNDSGYELVSPCFTLDPEQIKEYISNNETLLDHINADYSSNCGGHINLSRHNLTGEEFFNQIKGYLPLVYALNQDRINRNYCYAKKSDDLIKDKRKFQSIAIWDNRIEFRIFSAVQNFDQLIWRCELMELLTANLTDCPKVAYFHTATALEEHLKNGYDNDYFYTDNYSDYDEFLGTIKAYSLDYEGLEIE